MTPEQRELLLLWILITTNQQKYNPEDTANVTPDVILNNIAAEFNLGTGGNWNWDNLGRTNATAVLNPAINNGGAYDKASRNFQANVSAGWPAGASANGEHPTVAELKTLLNLPAQ